jgi:hypothetical protein
MYRSGVDGAYLNNRAGFTGKPVFLFGRLPQPCAAGAVLAKFLLETEGLHESSKNDT